MDIVYLDHNASAPLRPEAKKAVYEALESPGNASSVHGFGRQARKRVEDARQQVAALAGIQNPAQIIFTGSATESNNTVLRAFAGRRVLVSAIEHSSVLEVAPDAQRIPVTADGIVDMVALKELLDEEEPPALVSVMTVNSETGVIQPVAEIAELARSKGALFHTDAVQAAGRLPLAPIVKNSDFLSLSAHKIGGPQGVGALLVPNDEAGAQLVPLLLGGGHERRRRAGTENVAGIAGFGAAATAAAQGIRAYGPDGHITKLRDRLEQEILKAAPGRAQVFGANAPRVGNTAYIGLPGTGAETQLMALDLDGIAVGGSGSACSSGSGRPSHVLQAMGLYGKGAGCALRISLGWSTTDADIDRCLAAWIRMYERTHA